MCVCIGITYSIHVWNKLHICRRYIDILRSKQYHMMLQIVSSCNGVGCTCRNMQEPKVPLMTITCWSPLRSCFIKPASILTHPINQ